VAALGHELDRQIAELQRLGYPRLAGKPGEAFVDLLEPLRPRLRDLPGDSAIPFVIVVSRQLIPPGTAMELIGVVDMRPTHPEEFEPIDGLDIPDGPAYLLAAIDTGAETLNVTPDEALPQIEAAGRSALTIEEGVAVLTHHPSVLSSRNAFSLLGSRRGDRRVPALWTSRGSPRLGWCWAGNPHTWLGSASCAARLGAGGRA
jgi:Family of unknown function (DUF5701)